LRIEDRVISGGSVADITYGMKGRTPLDLADAEARLREALAAEGFGVLTEIDVAETLRTKLGIERAPYRILGACNPELAARALASEPDVGLLLPCNVIVYEDDSGTVVAALDPAMMVDVTSNPSLEPMAKEARRRLERAVAAVVDG
jgi:uncharacterized protein (DUF302 family)